MSAIKAVAVAGGSGALGSPLVKELLAANFTVTALARASSTNTFPPGVKVAKVDYEDIQSLKSALEGHDALVSTVGTAAVESQFKLVDAAIEAGVRRIIPSEFGCDTSLPKNQQLPVFAPKLKLKEHIKNKIQGTGTTYTYIYNNVFLDWSIDYKFGIDLKDRTKEIYDGGNNPYTATPLPFVARGVVGVLQHPDETANRDIRIHGAKLTPNKFLETAQRVVGKEGWKITDADTANLEKESWGILQNDPSQFYAWVPGFLKRALFGPGYGCDYSDNNDNELLGLKELSERDVEDIVRSRA